MGQTSYSSSSFWAKQIGIAVVLVIAAGVLIYMIQNQEQAPAPESQKEEKSVSKGLSEFYRDFRMSATDPQEDEQGDKEGTKQWRPGPHRSRERIRRLRGDGCG